MVAQQSREGPSLSYQRCTYLAFRRSIMPFHFTDYPDPHASSQEPFSHQLPPSDAELRHQIQARILADPWVHGDRVQVAVNQGVVTLTGTVDSLEAKRAADDDAWDTPGVREVHNDLVVASSV
jgi:hypothetical protein